jgi:hypothetical protein
MATLEEAAECPKCHLVGMLTGSDKKEIDGQEWDVTSYHCDNEDCSWYNTGWVVSSDKNGHVYERPRGERGMDKTFEPLSKEALFRGRAEVEEVIGRDAEIDVEHEDSVIEIKRPTRRPWA